MNTLRRAGIRRLVAYLCIAAALVAALMPGATVPDDAIPEPGWVLLPDVTTPSAEPPAVTGVGTGAVIVPVVPGRAPPTPSLHV